MYSRISYYSKKVSVDSELVYKATTGRLEGSTVLDAKAPMMLEYNFETVFIIELYIKGLKCIICYAINALTSQIMETMQSLKADTNTVNNHNAL